MKKKITKKLETKPRDTWIPQTWRYNGAGFEKSKKAYTRKPKYKKDYSQE